MCNSFSVKVCKYGLFVMLTTFFGCTVERSSCGKLMTEYEFLKQVETMTLNVEKNSVSRGQGGNLVSNRFDDIESAFACGRQKAMLVLEKVGDSPIALGYYTGMPPLGNDSFQRAYVYGWYCACVDYFATKMQHDDENLEFYRSYLFYRRRLDEIKRSNGVTVD